MRSPTPLLPVAGVDERVAGPAGKLAPLEVRGFHFHEGDAKWIARGVTYGPFRGRDGGPPFPARGAMLADLRAMKAASVNAMRVYTPPSDEVVEASAAEGIRLLVDVPWPKHLDVYGSRRLREQCREALRESAAMARRAPNLMGVLLGNEVPADIARWVGRRRVQELVRALCLEARELLPGVPLGFANYPSTEYLDLSFLDFLGFNVYLEREDLLRGYLARLRNLWPDKPLVLTETGADSLFHGEEGQARLVEEGVGAALDTGFAGTFVFAWTDEWHTGGHDIHDWDFGVVRRDRSPKPALRVLERLYSRAPQWKDLDPAPEISVVVATYNGAATLPACLDALLALDYPRFEVIVVDDGSTDETPAILSRFKGRVRVITQENRGLSAARNVGIHAARGEIVAFTDSDCMPDRDWLYHVARAIEGKWAGAGGPNVAPREERFLHRCVAFAPGHATQVLVEGEEAEHVPGCNMAFRRDALLATGCFDPVFRKAGDDVDMIWRLQEAGYPVRFAPAALVWHKRRSSPRDYRRQQAGYGEAEAMLARKHPLRFNDRGQSRWRGVVYSRPEAASLLRPPSINYGVFGAAGYQCIYDRPESPLVYFATSLDWWLLTALSAAAGVVAHQGWWLAGLMAATSLAISGMKARRRCRELPGLPRWGFPVVWWLWATQPLVREAARYRGRFGRGGGAHAVCSSCRSLPRKARRAFVRARVLEYWGEDTPHDRLDVLRAGIEAMAASGWSFATGHGWDRWDITVAVSPLCHVAVRSAAEDHCGGRRLLRLRADLRPSSLLWLVAAGLALAVALLWTHDTVLARGLLLAALVGGWWKLAQWRARAATVRHLLDNVARSLGFLPYPVNPGTPPAAGEGREADDSPERTTSP